MEGTGGLGVRKAEPRRAGPLAIVALSLLAWSTYAYAVARVNADILAEAIQVQQWLADPFWVWS